MTEKKKVVFTDVTMEGDIEREILLEGHTPVQSLPDIDELNAPSVEGKMEELLKQTAPPLTGGGLPPLTGGGLPPLPTLSGGGLPPLPGVLPGLLPPLESLKPKSLGELQQEVKKTRELEDQKTLEDMQRNGQLKSPLPVKFNTELPKLEELPKLNEIIPGLTLPPLKPIEVENKNLLNEGQVEEYYSKELSRLESLKQYRNQLAVKSSTPGGGASRRIYGKADRKIQDELSRGMKKHLSYHVFVDVTRPLAGLNVTLKEQEKALEEYYNEFVKAEFLEPLADIRREIAELEQTPQYQDNQDYINKVAKEKELDNYFYDVRNQDGLSQLKSAFFDHLLPAHREYLADQSEYNKSTHQEQIIAQKIFDAKVNSLKELSDAEVVATPVAIMYQLGVKEEKTEGVTKVEGLKPYSFICGSCKEIADYDDNSFVYTNTMNMKQQSSSLAAKLYLEVNHKKCSKCSAMNVLPREAIVALEEYYEEAYKELQANNSGTKQGTLTVRDGMVDKPSTSSYSKSVPSAKILNTIIGKYVPVNTQNKGTIFVDTVSHNAGSVLLSFDKVKSNWLTNVEAYAMSQDIENNDELKRVAFRNYILSDTDSKLFTENSGDMLREKIISTVIRSKGYQILKELNGNITETKLDVITLKKYLRFIENISTLTPTGIKLLHSPLENIQEFQKEVFVRTGVSIVNLFDKYDLSDLQISYSNIESLKNTINKRIEEIENSIKEDSDLADKYREGVYNSHNYRYMTFGEGSLTANQIAEFYSLAFDKEQVAEFLDGCIETVLHNEAVDKLIIKMKHQLNLGNKISSAQRFGKDAAHILDKMGMKKLTNYREALDTGDIEFDANGAEVLKALYTKNYYKLMKVTGNSEYTNAMDNAYGEYAEIVDNLEELGWTNEELLESLKELGEPNAIQIKQNYPKRRGSETLAKWYKDLTDGNYKEPLAKKKHEKKILEVFINNIKLEDYYAKELKEKASSTFEESLKNYISQEYWDLSVFQKSLSISKLDVAKRYIKTKEYLKYSVIESNVATGISLDHVLKYTPTMSPVSDESKIKTMTVRELSQYVKASAMDEEISTLDLENVENHLDYVFLEIEPEWLDDLASYETATVILESLKSMSL